MCFIIVFKILCKECTPLFSVPGVQVQVLTFLLFDWLWFRVIQFASVQLLSCVPPFATTRTTACQALNQVLGKQQRAALELKAQFRLAWELLLGKFCLQLLLRTSDIWAVDSGRGCSDGGKVRLTANVWGQTSRVSESVRPGLVLSGGITKSS